jgi:A/G-specific adenine glycosylase
MKPTIKKSHFTKILMNWYEPDARPMPWKAEKNPYLVWLSEIILQQTRVEQGLPYFNRFKNRYPAVEDLANASEDELMKLWEGLGYYNRARNLHSSAKFIAYDLNGIFPTTYNAILKLKGVGPYTASAISSFAFGLPHAVVDGNVYRVLSRIFGIEEAIDTTTGKKKFDSLAQMLLDKENPSEYNQAIIDFGAIQCSPKSPSCKDCPFNDQCYAFLNNQIDLFPFKSKKIKRKTRFFNYLILNSGDKVLIRKRSKKDIWRNLYEFPMIETNSLLTNQELFDNSVFQSLVGKDFKTLHSSKPLKQNLTHQKIISRFVELELEDFTFHNKDTYKIVFLKELDKFAFSKNIDWYLKDKSLYLETVLF